MPPSPVSPSVMIVDDEPAILDLVGRLAVRQGFEVLTCSNGREAIDVLKTRRVHMALVDLRMPEVGGVEVLSWIRASDPACQVVLMTGYGSINSAVEAIKLGATDYLTKPFDFDRLKGLLRGVREEFDRRVAAQAVD